MGQTGETVVEKMFLKALKQEPVMRLIRVEIVSEDGSVGIVINTN